MNLTINTHGQDIEVTVTEDGTFHAKVGMLEFAEKQLDYLKSQIHKTFQAARVNAPFVSQQGTRGFIRGFHASRRVALITWVGGSKGDISLSDYVFLPHEITDEEIAELKEIDATIQRLAQRRRDIQSKANLKVEAVLNDAIGENLTGEMRYDERKAAEKTVAETRERALA